MHHIESENVEKMLKSPHIVQGQRLGSLNIWNLFLVWRVTDKQSVLGPGGALLCLMATNCQTAGQSRGSEHQNLGAVNSFEGKSGGWSTLN